MLVPLATVLLVTSSAAPVAAPASLDGCGFSPTGFYACGGSSESEHEPGWIHHSFEVWNLANDERVLELRAATEGRTRAPELVRYEEQVRDALRKYGIELRQIERTFVFPLEEGGDEFTVEFEVLDPDEEVPRANVYLVSKLQGRKKIGEYGGGDRWFEEGWTASYQKSPFEPRIVVVIQVRCLGFEAEPDVCSAQYGAWLDRGFKKPKSKTR